MLDGTLATVDDDPDDLFTVEQFKKALPKGVKLSNIGPMVDDINNIIMDPEFRDTYRDNILSYTSVMKDGKYKIKQYLDAVRYCSYKLMDMSNLEAYTRTFPDRYQAHLQRGTSQKDIASHISSYNKGKLVQAIMGQTMTPSYILNQDLYQKALNVSADLMMNANSEKVRADAANNLMNQLKMPETSKVELDITVSEGSAIAELNQATMALAAQQRAQIANKLSSAQDVAHSKVITGEYEEM